MYIVIGVKSLKQVRSKEMEHRYKNRLMLNTFNFIF